MASRWLCFEVRFIRVPEKQVKLGLFSLPDTVNTVNVMLLDYFGHMPATRHAALG